MATNQTELQHFYYKEVLLKKEGSKNWIECYGALYSSVLTFHFAESSKEMNRKTPPLQISKNSKCFFTEKKCYRFPFAIQTGKEKYFFKCETQLQRYRWMYALRLCISGKPPEPIPNFIEPNHKIQRLSNKSCRTSDSAVKSPVLNFKFSYDSCVGTNFSSSEESSKLLNKTLYPGKNRTVHMRSESDNLDEELRKTDKKTVKWDFREAIASYVIVNSDTIIKNKDLHKLDNSIAEKYRKDGLSKDSISKWIFKRGKKQKSASGKVAAENNYESDDNTSFKEDKNLRSSLKHKHFKTKSADEASDLRVEEGVQVENLSKVPKEDDELESSHTNYFTSNAYVDSNVTIKKRTVRENFPRESISGDLILTKNNLKVFLNPFDDQKVDLFSCNMAEKNPVKRPAFTRPAFTRTYSLNSIPVSRKNNVPRRGTSAPVLRFSRRSKVAPEIL